MQFQKGGEIKDSKDVYIQCLKLGLFQSSHKSSSDVMFLNEMGNVKMLAKLPENTPIEQVSKAYSERN